MNTSLLQSVPVEMRTLNEEPIPTANARQLWKWLEVETRFNDWIVQRIQDGKFEKDVDYCLSVTEKKVADRINNLRTVSHTYHISLDMAKHLAMMERNAKGHEARKYFIDFENQTRKLIQGFSNFPVSQNPLYGFLQHTRENDIKLKGVRNDYVGVLNSLGLTAPIYIQTLTNSVHEILLGMKVRRFRRLFLIPEGSRIRTRLYMDLQTRQVTGEIEESSCERIQDENLIDFEKIHNLVCQVALTIRSIYRKKGVNFRAHVPPLIRRRLMTTERLVLNQTGKSNA